MAFEGAQMVPVYDMNKSDGDGFMGGGAGWMWVVMLFSYSHGAVASAVLVVTALMVL